MNTKTLPCLKLPAFIFTYPFTVLLLARLYSLVCLLSILFIWYLAMSYFDQTAALIAISDLIALLLILVSLWFMIQKFFYVKLDAALSAVSLLFAIGGLTSACSTTQKSSTNHLLYIIICHLYLFVAQFFSLGWTLVCTRNSISQLFISNWGKSVTQNEVELLERDF